MKCTNCGATINKKPIREEASGEIHYYCSLSCFEEQLRRRSKQLRRALVPKTAVAKRRVSGG